MSAICAQRPLAFAPTKPRPAICNDPGFPRVGVTVIVVFVQLPPSIVDKNTMASSDTRPLR
jgi:hypothetical protein